MRGNIVENESRLGLGSLGFGLWFFTQSVSDTFTSVITSRSIPLQRPNPKDSKPKTQDPRPKTKDQSPSYVAIVVAKYQTFPYGSFTHALRSP